MDAHESDQRPRLAGASPAREETTQEAAERPHAAPIGAQSLPTPARAAGYEAG
jgi:hypothetical protein